MRYLREYNSFNKYDIKDVAWLYFLHFVYGGKLKIESWENDKRMDGRKSSESFSKFDCVKTTSEYYLSTKECVKIINKFFKMGFEEACRYKKPRGNKAYNISSIPYDYYLERNPSIENAFDRIRERIVYHFNSQRVSNQLMDQLSKSRRIKEWNISQFISNFPEDPKTITVYRGLKSEYKPDGGFRQYSAWTTSKKEAERFAHHHFSGGMQFSPIYSQNPHLLESKITYDDIVIYIGGDENEVILRNPVKNVKVTKLESKREF